MIVRLLLLAACWHECLSQVLTPSQVTISYHKPITATATCGEINGQPINEMYCSLAGSTQYTPINQYSYHVEDQNAGAYQELRREREAFVQGGHGCGFCRADAEDKAHPATNMVDGNNSWWMSPPLSRGMQYNQINITIDLNQEFHVAYVWVQMANSPKPGTWALERSVDYGKTWKPWFYFADSDAECMRRFGVESLAPIERDDQVICRSDLSSIHPLENGEILLNLMEHRPSRESFMSSTTLQDFTRATNVRMRLIGTRTLQGHLMDLNDMRDPTVTRRYFYAIKEILMGGRCVCNGHASTCDIVDQLRPTTLVCRCEHNTCGDMCEQCCPGFVAKEWQKTTATNNFTCEPCQCFGRTNECEFDESVVGQSLDIHGNKEGGGRCRNCRYNTEGVNCNQCVRGYFRPESREWSDLQPCEQCRCDPSKHNGACAELTGKCECLDRFTGENCDQCAPGYHSPPECLPCDCKAPGTKGDVCTPTNGTCPCNPGYGGDFCERCGDGFTNLTAGCKECGCDTVGSVHNKCDLASGDCVCKAQFGGKKCEECAGGYYDFPNCKYCDCDPSGTENGVCDGKSGQCLCKEGFAGRHCDQCDLNFYGYPNCKPCGCDGAGALSGECDAKTGDCQCSGNYTARTCDKCAAGFYGYPECKECSCLHEGAKGLTCDQFGQCFCKENFHGARCETCKPNFYNFPLCEACNCDPKGVSRNFRGCDKVAPGELCECNTNVQGRICNECKPTFWDLQSYHTGGCVDCGCHLAGTISRLNTCKQASGQCNCKRNVGGRACDKCAPGYFNLESFHPHGCEPCNCDVGGALKGDCDSENGQCKCRPRVTGVRCDEPLQHHYFPTLWHHQYEAEDGHTPDNRGVRFAWDPEIFPNFSSRGFAVFSPIQDTILINLEAPKATVSRILLKVHNPSNVTMTAQVTLSRATATPGDTEQTAKVSFPPSSSPYISEVTLSGKPFVISAGSWVLKVETKQRLFWDFVVILPSQYYEGTNLVQTHNKACEAGVRDGEACLDLLYPPLPNVARADVTKEGLVPFDITDGDGQRVPLEMVPYELVREDIGPAAFVRADNISRIINAKIDVPDDDKYVILLEYHNREKTDLPLGMNITQDEKIHSGECTVHYCPYSSFCRELITEKGQPLVLPLTKGKAQISLSVSPNHEFGLSAVNLIREKDWSNQYLQQVPVCVRRNGLCEPLSFPAAAESVVVEAELGQRESRPMVGDKLSFNVDHPEDLIVVPLDMNNPNLEVSGVVQSPYHYMIIVHYFNNDNTPQTIDALVSSRDNHFEAVVPFAYCPSVGGCRALIREKDRPESIQFWLEDKYTVQFLGKDLGNLKGPIHIDSITAIPYQHFSASLMSPLPLDLSGDFIESCSEQFFQNDPKTNVSDACKAHIFSLTTEFNQAAFPCECSSQGSTSFDCEKYGGQCECRENIMGRRCDQCAPGYYGFPECKKCKCGKNQLCDSRTGQCSCPLHVEGTECDRCVGFAFGYDRLIGCQKCGCDPQGSEGGQAVCDAESGQCLCKEHVGGRQCDSCLAGHFGFPYCHECRCNKEGTTAQICDGTTAQCKCKENVVGRECEQCKAGTFALSKDHDKGCIDCFCFGATDRCQSSHMPVTLMTIDHSLVKATDAAGKVEVDDTNHVVYTGGEERPKVVYWDIPVRKEKDYTLTYGLKMTIELSSASHTDGHTREADIVLRGGNYTGEFWSEEQPVDPSLPFKIQMKITPESLQHPNGLPMQRDEVMMMLHSLSSIRVKASFYTSAPSAELIDFTLETADANSIEPVRAVTVERCACPAPYTGLSCQECADGYYRVKSGKYLGSCVPCNCHGHSGTCDKETGLCTDCQHSTEGEHCETCIEGFYGDATSGSPFACSACACPYAPENNFATSCDVSDEGQTRMCFCKPGYAGDRCEKCAPGFFGDPEASGGSCEPCQCNGNNDLRDPQACHELYGSCHLCQNNTAGDHCESCAPWYHGDAVTTKNCSSCECDQCGAHSCSPLTGSCACKTNVVGERCDRCAADHWGFSRCGGCHNCHCGAASSSSQCDGLNGQCPCRPGATGLRCEQCEYGFWNYGEAGCTKCDCEADLSLGTVCDVFTGQCHCQEGATGARCDKCLPEYLRIPTMGCRKCDECVHHLKADVDSLDGDLTRLSLAISNISAGTIDGARLAKYSKQMNNIQETQGLLNGLQSTESDSLLSTIKGGLEEAAVIRVHSDTTKKGSEENVKKTEKLVQGMYTLNIDSKENIKSSAQVVESLRQLSIALEASAGKPKPIPHWIEESKEIVKKLEESSGRLEEMDGGKMSTGVSKARDAMKEVKEKEEKMKKAIEEKREKERQLKEYVDDAIQLVTKAKTSSQKANDRTGRMNVGKTEAMTKSVNEDAERTKEGLAKIATLTKEVSAYAEQLAELGEDLKTILASLNETMETFESEKDKRMYKRFKRGSEGTADLSAVNAKVVELEGQSSDLKNKFAATKEASKGAVDAASVYDELSEKMKKASDAAEKAKTTVEEEKGRVDELRTDIEESTKQTNDALSNSEKIRGEMKEVEKDLKGVNEKKETVQREIEKQRERIDKITGGGRRVNETMKEKLENFVKTDAKEETKMEEVRAKVADLEAKAAEKVEGGMAGQLGLKQARANLKEISERKDKGPAEWRKHVDALRNATHRVDRLNEQLRKLKENLAMARDAVNKVSLPAHFEVGSSLDVALPQPPSHSSVATDLTVVFRTNRDGIPVYLGNVRNAKMPVPTTDDYLSVEVEQGRPVVNLQLGDEPLRVALNTRIDDNEWHRLDISRVGRSIRSVLMTPDGKVTMETKTATSTGEHAVLNLQKATSKMYLGGIPIESQVNLRARSFIGDISEVILNGDSIGLWSVNEGGIASVNGANKRNTEESAFEREVGVSDGFLVFPLAFWNPRKQTKLSLSFLTYAPDGLLFYLGKDKKFLSIELSQGIVKVAMDLGSGVGTLQTETSYNDGEWHSIQFVREERQIQLNVDNETIKFEMKGDGTELAVGDYYYLGGVPLDVNTRSTIAEPFRGCIRNVKLKDDVVNIRSAHRSKGVSASCPSVSLTREVSFLSDRSSAIFKNVILGSIDQRLPFDLAFRFKTRQANTLMCTVKNDDDETVLSVHLEGGEVAISGGEGKERSRIGSSVADGSWHYVSIRRENSRVQVSLDDVYFSTMDKIEMEGESPMEKYSLIFGKQKDDHYIGCIRDVTFGATVLEFAKSERREVRLTGCSMKEVAAGEVTVEDAEVEKEKEKEEKKKDGKSIEDELEPPAPVTTLPTSTLAPQKQITTVPLDPADGPVKEKFFPSTCALGNRHSAELSGYRFGLVQNTMIGFNEGMPESFNREGTLSLRIRPDGAFGPLFYAHDEEHQNYLSVYLNNGVVAVASNTTEKRKILLSKTPVVDGRWHEIKIQRKGVSVQLTVDEEFVEAEVLSVDSISFVRPFWIGGAPLTEDHKSKTLANIGQDPQLKKGVEYMGCIDAVTINKNQMEEPAFNTGVEPCSNDRELGMYLGPKGGYAVKQPEEPVISFLTEIMFRSRSTDGLIYSAGKVDYAALYMEKGEMNMLLKTAAGATCQVKFTPPANTTFCDGHWHHVRVYRKKKLITMAVDGTSNMNICSTKGVDFTLNDPFVFGKPPKGMVHDDLLKHETFVGCLRMTADSLKGGAVRKRRNEQRDYNEYKAYDDWKKFGDAQDKCPTSCMVHRGFKRESETKQPETMAPFNTEKREVFDTPDMNSEVSRRMGELLLRGHTMLNAECECGGILMEDRQGVRRCIACEVREEAPADTVEQSSSSSVEVVEVDEDDRVEMREYVSTNMGKLLMRGHTMLDANCSCSCILMEDRDGKRTCLACEFRQNKKTKKNTVEDADCGFKVIEIPLNGEIPSSSRAVQMDWDEEDEKVDAERDAITARMGEYLLKGVAMLDEYCHCGGIMMQERGGRKLCVDCEVRNEGKGVKEEKEEPAKKVKKTEEKAPKQVSFQEQDTPLRKALPPSEWKTVVQMTVESKLIWLSNRLSKTEDYDEMAKILDLIDKATNVAKNL